MTTKSIKVVAQADTFHRIAKARPLSALAELVWNSLDADATDVRVYFVSAPLGLQGIVVEDNGLGATPGEAADFFRKLGGSWKKPGAKTKLHTRAIHGSQGQGRYKALSLGRVVTWRYFYQTEEGIFEFSLEILADNPSEVRPSEPKPSDRPTTGCIVHIQEPWKQFKGLDGEQSAAELTEQFAIYLADYPDVSVRFGEHDLNPENAIANQVNIVLGDITLKTGEVVSGGEVRILEWSHIDRRSLLICDAKGFAAAPVPTKFQLKRFSFSAYLSAPHLEVLDQEDRLDLADLDPVALQIVHAAKDAIKDHYEGEEKRAAARTIQEWKAAKIYPYDEEPKSKIEEAERQVFEIVAIKVQSAHADFASSPKKVKALQLELLRHAIETGPNQLRELLSRVVDLPQREQNDLAKLLEETTLSSIIGAAKVVTDRLNFLRGLYQVVYDYQTSGRIKERSQLHRILAQNAWLFGEEFAVSTDDRDLTTVLRAHKRVLDEDIVIDGPVKHVDQSTGIVDLMLSRLLRRHRANEVEHLVVELKRPGVSVGSEEIAQIKKYAASIEADGRFATRQGVVWRFWVISDKLNEMGKYEVKQDKTGQGLVRDTDTAKIHVVTWDQIIEENKARYQFIQERLNFAADDERSMRFLREEHAALLEGVAVVSDGKVAAA